MKAGAIYQVVPFSSSKLAIGVNHAVCVLSWNDDESALVEECSYQNNILSLFLKTKGDFILVSYEYHTLVEHNTGKKCGFLVKVINHSIYILFVVLVVVIHPLLGGSKYGTIILLVRIILGKLHVVLYVNPPPPPPPPPRGSLHYLLLAKFNK